jgi:hypothetical protein
MPEANVLSEEPGGMRIEKLYYRGERVFPTRDEADDHAFAMARKWIDEHK